MAFGNSKFFVFFGQLLVLVLLYILTRAKNVSSTLTHPWNSSRGDAHTHTSQAGSGPCNPWIKPKCVPAQHPLSWDTSIYSNCCVSLLLLTISNLLVSEHKNKSVQRTVSLPKNTTTTTKQKKKNRRKTRRRRRTEQEEAGEEQKEKKAGEDHVKKKKKPWRDSIWKLELRGRLSFKALESQWWKCWNWGGSTLRWHWGCVDECEDLELHVTSTLVPVQTAAAPVPVFPPLLSFSTTPLRTAPRTHLQASGSQSAPVNRRIDSELKSLRK